MARIRTIKPEFWQNETLAELPAMTRLLAIGLLNHADDEGYFKANPALIRAAIFPFDDSANVPGMLQELSKAGYLRIRQGEDGKAYGWVVTFLKHQRVDKPKQSEIKDLCDFQDDSENHPRIIPDESKPEGKGKEQGTGKGTGKGNTSSSAVRDVFVYWQSVMGKPGAILTPKRDKAVTAALKLGYTVDQIKSAIDGCKRSPFHMGVNDQRTVYDDLELICRNGENIEKFISNIGAGSGVETIDMTHNRIQAQADRVAAYLEDVGA